MLPVEAHATARRAGAHAPGVTATVMPRSLKEPVGFSPSCFEREVGVAGEARDRLAPVERRAALGVREDRRRARAAAARGSARRRCPATAGSPSRSRRSKRAPQRAPVLARAAGPRSSSPPQAQLERAAQRRARRSRTPRRRARAVTRASRPRRPRSRRARRPRPCPRARRPRRRRARPRRRAAPPPRPAASAPRRSPRRRRRRPRAPPRAPATKPGIERDPARLGHAVAHRLAQQPAVAALEASTRPASAAACPTASRARHARPAAPRAPARSARRSPASRTRSRSDGCTAEPHVAQRLGAEHDHGAAEQRRRDVVRVAAGDHGLGLERALRAASAALERTRRGRRAPRRRPPRPRPRCRRARPDSGRPLRIDELEAVLSRPEPPQHLARGERGGVALAASSGMRGSETDTTRTPGPRRRASPSRGRRCPRWRCPGSRSPAPRWRSSPARRRSHGPWQPHTIPHSRARGNLAARAQGVSGARATIASMSLLGGLRALAAAPHRPLHRARDAGAHRHRAAGLHLRAADRPDPAAAGGAGGAQRRLLHDPAGVR